MIDFFIWFFAFALLLIAMLSACVVPAILGAKSFSSDPPGPAVDVAEALPSDPWAPITPEKRYELYIQQSKQYEDFAQKNSDSFEKAMITLSGGALGLSMTFLGFVKDRQHIEAGFLIPTSWILFALSLILMIWSFQITHDAYDRQLTILDRRYFEFSDENNPLRMLPNRIAAIAVWLFYAGITCLCTFGFMNWKHIIHN
ncbi:MAG: hypothetical protein KGS72_21525 [Cyanobacteria bacterium REEB67]|nr:hypothetical protein [Cyanobacteria bacterium REEB67]